MSGIYGIFFGLSGVWGNIIGSAFLNPWSLEKQNINGSSGDYVFTDDRILERVPQSWLLLAGVIFALLFPGLIFIENEDAKGRKTLSVDSECGEDQYLLDIVVPDYKSHKEVLQPKMKRCGVEVSKQKPVILSELIT